MSYFIRLVDVCLASFFVVNLALELVVLCVSPYVVRLAERMRASAGARLLLALRLLPMVATTVAVAAWCVPSYLRYEDDASESIALTCTALALGGLVILAASAARLVWGLNASARMLKDQSAAEHTMFALVGFLRPRVIVSSRIREALSSSQMEAALLHEAAHSSSLDNLKRLAMLAAPRPLGLRRLRRLESEWSRMAEWAADDAAVAGEPRRAIALAEALVCVARLSGRLEGSAVISSLVARNDELGERVERLLGQRLALQPGSRAVPAAAGTVFALSLVLLAMRQNELLLLVHSAMERLAH